MLRPVPHANVLVWVSAQISDAVFTPAISQGEMLYGVYLLAAGQRRDRLYQEVEAIFSVDMSGRVLAYDSAAADAHAMITAERRAQGRPISQSDAMIAGIVRSRGAQLATHNRRDFEGCDIALIDPWH